MRTDKELGAMRVMEALSAVDEELLERSGKTAAESGNSPAETLQRKKPRRLIRRYAMAWAACFCLVVLGAAYFGLGQIRMGAAGDSGSGDMKNGGADNHSELLAADTGNASPKEMEEGMAQEAAGNSASDGAMAVRVEPEWLDVESLAALPEETVEQAPGVIAEEQASPASPEKETEREQPEDIRQDVDSDDVLKDNKLNKEDFREKADVPEGYSPMEPDAGSGQQESPVYEWSDGEHSLWLRVTLTELRADERIDAEPPVYTVQEEWEELIPDAGPDGYVQFALLYDNGMLVEYCGALEKEEIVRLLESLRE